MLRMTVRCSRVSDRHQVCTNTMRVRNLCGRGWTGPGRSGGGVSGDFKRGPARKTPLPWLRNSPTPPAWSTDRKTFLPLASNPSISVCRKRFGARTDTRFTGCSTVAKWRRRNALTLRRSSKRPVGSCAPRSARRGCARAGRTDRGWPPQGLVHRDLARDCSTLEVITDNGLRVFCKSWEVSIPRDCV